MSHFRLARLCLLLAAVGLNTAPALMTYGFAAPALAAVNAWLAGEIEAAGQCPVPGF